MKIYTFSYKIKQQQQPYHRICFFFFLFFFPSFFFGSFLLSFYCRMTMTTITRQLMLRLLFTLRSICLIFELNNMKKKKKKRKEKMSDVCTTIYRREYEFYRGSLSGKNEVEMLIHMLTKK